jgi:hypothetical protein
LKHHLIRAIKQHLRESEDFIFTTNGENPPKSSESKQVFLGNQPEKVTDQQICEVRK